MAAKVIRDRFGREVNGDGQQRRRRRRRSAGPEGRGPGGYAGQDTVEGDKVEVNCAPEAAATGGKKDKKKFPWGTVFITGAVTAVGLSIGYKLFEKATGGGKEKAESNPRQLGPHDMLMAMPGAGNSITPFAMMNQGPSERELQLLEREAQLRERLAELEGFIAAQTMQSQKQTDLERLMAQMDEDD